MFEEYEDLRHDFRNDTLADGAKLQFWKKLFSQLLITRSEALGKFMSCKDILKLG